MTRMTIAIVTLCVTTGSPCFAQMIPSSAAPVPDGFRGAYGSIPAYDDNFISRLGAFAGNVFEPERELVRARMVAYQNEYNIPQFDNAELSQLAAEGRAIIGIISDDGRRLFPIMPDGYSCTAECWESSLLQLTAGSGPPSAYPLMVFILDESVPLAAEGVYSQNVILELSGLFSQQPTGSAMGGR